MAQTIVRLVLMIFLSVIILMLALYSTTFKARARRCFIVYEIIAIFLIIGDHNLILGVIEFIIFQIIIIFSTINCLYAYAEIEINEKEELTEQDCTTLMIIPLVKQTAEVDQETIHSIQELSQSIFVACLAALIIIRPTLLFPFYGRNAATFIFGIIITIFTFYTSSAGGDSRRAIEDTSWDASSFFLVCLATILAYGFIQLIALFVYMDADEKAQQNNIIQDSIPASYGKMLPINHIYDYKDQIPYSFHFKERDITDDIYLIRTYDVNNNACYYYSLYAFDEIQKTIDGVSDAEVHIHLVEKDMEPHVDIYPVFYLNPRGEEDISKNIYHFYLQEEQIITY